MVNLIDPILIPHEEMDRFIRTHKCGLCGSHLTKYPAPERMCYAVCPNCGRCTPDMVVKKTISEKVARDRRQAMRELKPDPKPARKRTPEEIIKDLGF